MKKLLLAVLFVFMMVGVSSSADDIFTDRDDSAVKYTKALVDDLCIKLAEDGRPCLSTGARAIPDKDIVFMFWVELEEGIFYYEMKTKMINSDEELSNKYNVVGIDE